MPSFFDDSARASLVAGARRVADAGLIVGSAGNLSLRSGQRVLITRGGSELDALALEDCVDVGLNETAIPEDHRSGPQPSSELALHLAIYEASDALAIVHTHSNYATILGTVADELPAIHYMINHFGGPVRVARYETFGTEELAASVIEALRERCGALMANHGAVVTGRDIGDAVGKAILLEWLASVYYHATLFGSPTILSSAELEAVRTRARQLRYGVEAGHEMIDEQLAAKLRDSHPAVACVGTYIVDVLGRPVSELPRGQVSSLLEEIRITPAGTAGGTSVDLARLGGR